MRVAHIIAATRLPLSSRYASKLIRAQMEIGETIVEPGEMGRALSRHSRSLTPSKPHYCRIKNCEFVWAPLMYVPERLDCLQQFADISVVTQQHSSSVWSMVAKHQRVVIVQRKKQ